MSTTPLDDPRILSILFYPQQAPAGTCRIPGVRDGTIATEDGVALGYRLYPSPAPHAPVILYFHGNGEIAPDYDDIATLYVSRGITLLVADYRGYGWSTGNPLASTLLPDAWAVFEATADVLRRAGLPPNQLFVMGRSLGSAPAIEIASRAQDRLCGLIVESGFAHTFVLLARLGLRVEGASEAEHGLGNLLKIKRVTLPTLVIHGQSDRLIPAEEGRALYAASLASDKQLVLIGGAGHNDLMFVGMDRYFDAIQAFVRRACTEQG
jgi:alpha-beta hydrolase superfamily lysophospholipase